MRKSLIALSAFLSIGLPLFSQTTSYPWSNERHQALAAQAHSTALWHRPHYPAFDYPVTSPGRVLDLYDGKHALIFAHGSLLNRESASQTVGPVVVETFKPAVAFGLKRLFDLNVPYCPRWKALNNPHHEAAMLNVRQEEDFSSAVNGIVMEVGAEDLTNLLRREVGYDLVPVPVVLWEDALDPARAPQVTIAYAFAACEQERHGALYVSHEIVPVKTYAEASEEGARGFGDAFLSMWRETTFLADGFTPFRVWEEHPDKELADLEALGAEPRQSS